MSSPSSARVPNSQSQRRRIESPIPVAPLSPNPKINVEWRRGSEAERPPVRSKGRTRQRCSLHTGGPSDAFERNEPATDGQAPAACRVRAPAVDLVHLLGASPPLPPTP